jgi:hypothetical protein
MLFFGLLCAPCAGIITTTNNASSATPRGGNSLFIFIRSYEQRKAFVEHSQCRITQIRAVMLTGLGQRCSCLHAGLYPVRSDLAATLTLDSTTSWLLQV